MMGQRDAAAMPDGPTGKPQQFVAVQYLRAIAAFLVVGIHLQEQLAKAGWSANLITFGSAGVDIFFVISGFVMWHTTRESVSTGQFYYRRIVRIVPLYWLLTSVMLAVLLLAPSLVKTAALDWGHVASSYFFVAQEHPVLTDAMFPLLIPGWTLNYEMFFYALFGALLLLGRETRLVCLVGVLMLLSAMHFTLEEKTGVAGFYTNPILLEFAAGVLLGYAVERGLTINWILGWVLVALGAALIVAHFDTIRILRDGVGAILLVTGVVLAEARKVAPRQSFALLLGDSSYSLYLVHGLVLAAMIQIYQRLVGLETMASAVLYVIVSLAAVTVAAIILYRGFEKPSLRWLRGRFARKVSRNW